MNNPKTYLGDSVYATNDGFTITLTTENGKPDDPSNIIHLDRYTMVALIAYYRRMIQPPDDPSPP